MKQWLKTGRKRAAGRASVMLEFDPRAEDWLVLGRTRVATAEYKPPSEESLLSTIFR
jgi:hypothetical protein